MAELSPKQLIFVQEYMRSGNATAAAISAGYSEKTAYSAGPRMLKNVGIQQYLNKKEANVDRDLREMFVGEAVEAYKVLKNLMLTAQNESVQLNAAKDFLDRAGYKPIDKIVADVTNIPIETYLREL